MYANIKTHAREIVFNKTEKSTYLSNDSKALFYLNYDIYTQKAKVLKDFTKTQAKICKSPKLYLLAFNPFALKKLEKAKLYTILAFLSATGLSI